MLLVPGAPSHQALERVQSRGHLASAALTPAAVLGTDARTRSLAGLGRLAASGRSVLHGLSRGAFAVNRDKPVNRSTLSGACLPRGRAIAPCRLPAAAPQIDRHGHVFMDVDLAQVQPGMSKDQVTHRFRLARHHELDRRRRLLLYLDHAEILRVLQALGDRPQGGGRLFRSEGHRTAGRPIWARRTVS